VAVLSAGTADEAVAEECRLTADVMGCYCFRLPDVSVDGLHRLLQNLPGAPPYVLGFAVKATHCYCFRLPDVSVDGLHRLLQNLPGAPS